MKHSINISNITFTVSVPLDDKKFNAFFEDFVKPWIEEDAKKENYFNLRPWDEIKEIVFPIMVKHLLLDGVEDGFGGGFTDTLIREKVYDEIMENFWDFEGKEEELPKCSFMEVPDGEGGFRQCKCRISPKWKLMRGNLCPTHHVTGSPQEEEEDSDSFFNDEEDDDSSEEYNICYAPRSDGRECGRRISPGEGYCCNHRPFELPSELQVIIKELIVGLETFRK